MDGAACLMIIRWRDVVMTPRLRAPKAVTFQMFYDRLSFRQLVAEAQQVAAMRAKGASYREIGPALGHSHMWAWRRAVWLRDMYEHAGGLSRTRRLPVPGHVRGMPRLAARGPRGDLARVDAELDRLRRLLPPST